MATWEDVIAIVPKLPWDPAFFTTAHHDNHAAVLVHLNLADQEQLAELVVEA